MKSVVLVACGAFSPITYAHLRMFELARDHLKRKGYNVVRGLLSPVSDDYNKEGMTISHHRLNMCRLACETSNWIRVDAYEAASEKYTPTVKVLESIKGRLQIEFPSCEIFLLAGSDLVRTMDDNRIWDTNDVLKIKQDFGLVVIKREESNFSEISESYNDKVYHVSQPVKNDISSTSVRKLLKNNCSIKYLVPDEVLQYIERVQPIFYR